MPRTRQARDRADHTLVGTIRIPVNQISPYTAIIRRVLGASAALVASVFLVYLDRDGYRDVNGDGLSLLDCFYYATVSLSTTGYGDIAPFTPTARLVNVLVITPLRVMFLIVLVGTTLEVLTERSRQAFKIQRWRNKVHAHTVVIGYGTKGRAAVAAMLGDDVDPERIVVVDTETSVLDAASSLGLVTVNGSATSADILRLAGVPGASTVLVATNRDDTAVLVTLTSRELNASAKIIVSVREAENVHLLKQSGADSVVVSSETAGRLLGLATSTPSVVEMMEDLLTPDAGFAIAEREVERTEVGGSPRHLSDIVLGVVRGGVLHRVDAEEVDSLEIGDRLLHIRHASNGS